MIESQFIIVFQEKAPYVEKAEKKKKEYEKSIRAYNNGLVIAFTHSVVLLLRFSFTIIY